MKIAMFHVNLPSSSRKPGGVEVFVDRLSNALSVSGYDVEVFSLSKAPKNASYKHRHIFKHFRFLCRNRFCLLFVLPIFLNFVDFSAYDVLHLHGTDWFFVNRRITSVRTFYGSALWEARFSTRFLRRLSLYLVYPLEHLSRYLCSRSLGLGFQTAHLYHADDVANLFAPRRYFYPGTKTVSPSFVFVGTWYGRKRGHFIFDIFQKTILPKIPNAILFMASDFVPAAPSVINLLSPAEDVLGRVIRESWLLLSASTYEGFGLPYLEAMMSGTAIVTTRNAGAEYVLRDGQFGVISDDADFAEKILQLVEDTPMRQRYEVAGLAHSLIFSEEQVVAEYLASYRLAIGKFKNATGQT